MSVLRDIFRRKGRSLLTMSGIGIGVFALVVLGAVAENQNVYVSKLVDFFEDTIVVVEEGDANFVGMASGKRPLSMGVVEELREYPGVREVSPQVTMLLETEYMSVIPPMVLGVEPGSNDYEAFSLAKGRDMEPASVGVTLLGSDLAHQLGADVGETIDVRDKEFEVVGILDRTYVNLLDAAAYVPIADAQQLYFASLPEAFQESVDPDDLVLQLSVHVEPGEDPETVAAELNRDIDGILATGPTTMMETVDGLIALINTIVWSIAMLALVISVLSVVNTMMTAVSERTREIGVKRALGASRWRVGRDVLFESSVMGGIGGLGGLIAGALIVLALNSAMIAATGTTSLLMTGRLALGAMLFAIVLGTLGGLYPAYHASRMEPAVALAHE